METEKTLTLTCCGGKKCPVATLRTDGGVTLEDTVAGRTDTIVLSREQIEKLARFVGLPV